MQLTFPHRETWLHRVNPSLKLFVLACVFVFIILIHNPNVLINVTISLLLFLAIGTGHPWRRMLLYTSPFILIFISTTTGMMFFGQGETTVYKLGLLHITEESAMRGMHLGFRALCMAASGLLFSLTTKPVSLFYSLMQQLRLPSKYAYSFLAGLRMMPIVFEEFVTRRQALKIRGGSRRRGLAKLYDALHLYAIPLLAQSIRRAQRTAVAMQAKRFVPGVERTYYYRIGYSGYDALFLLALTAAFSLAYYVGLTAPYFSVTDVR